MLGTFTQDTINIDKLTPTQYRKHINKKIKNFTDNERIHYLNLRVRKHRADKLKINYKKYKRAD
tara:strand:+ start:1762 stop:1953 length:192 start_codon:yes stop_codon:yes gene_type:complete